jgi:LAGLIDADG endonuclease
MSTFNITGNWIAGFTDAEGSFCIWITGVQQITVSFCFYISQKETEPLIQYADFINARVSEFPEFAGKKVFLKKGGGIMNIKIKQHDLLFKVVKPLFEEFPLYSSKRLDFLLFFEALTIYTNPKMSRHERILQVIHIMFSMNTKGAQRVNNKKYYERLLEPKFPNRVAYQNAITKAYADQKQRIVQHLIKHPKSSPSDDYFVGLLVGDGCFGCDFDMRQGRKATVIKSLSVSLIKTNQNEELLDLFAKRFDTRWNKRPSVLRRHSFKIERHKDIQKIQTFFILHSNLLPSFKKRDLEIWSKATLLKDLLKDTKAVQTHSEQRRAYALITEIYFFHQGIYRKYSLEDVLKRFSMDYFKGFIPE